MANAHSSELVYLLFVEVSDQTGKIRLAGIFSSRELAEAADRQFPTRRTIIEEWTLNEIDSGAHGVRFGRYVTHSDAL